jgi:NADPH:quinone reductase-like Zn-dependent oxidoreductase
MRAAFIDELGPAEAIRYGDVDEPVAGSTDVLIEVLATTVNPVDTFVRSGLFRTPIAFPFVIGRDVVGAVVSAGARVTGFASGDLVWCNSLGHGGRQGAAAERAVVPAERLYRVPAGVDPLDLVAVIHPAATAYLALFTHGGLRAGETVLVAGAAGNVGSALVTLAVDAGATVIATARAEDAGYCRELGAAEVFDYRDAELAEEIRRVCPQGIDVYLDTSGVNELTTAVDLLALRGRIVLLAGARTRPVLPAGPLYMKDGALLGFVISNATTTQLADASVEINRLVAAGTLRARTVNRLPLDQAARAHRLVQDGQSHGQRILLSPDRSVAPSEWA